jgi:hypothetical protein
MPPYCPPQAWVNADYLLWWLRSQPNPQALLRSTGVVPVAGTPTAMDDPVAQTVVGGRPINMNAFSGGKLTAGLWFNYERCFGFEGSGFYLGENSSLQRASSDPNTGLPILGRPYFDVNLGAESASPVSFPALLAGDLSVVSRTRLYGGEGNFLHLISSSTEDTRISVMFGGRYLNLTESMDITSDVNLLPNAVGLGLLQYQGNPLVPPQGLRVLDTFRTQNQFIGGQVGFRTEWFGSCWYAKIQGEFAVGTVQQTLNISGLTSLVNSPGGGAVSQAPGGFFAQRSNSGQFTRNPTGVLPSMEAQFAYELVPNFCWFDVGYSFLAMTNAIRPGLTIDRQLNLTQAPSIITLGLPQPVTQVQRPAPLFGEQTFWAHGLSIGLRFTY